MKIEINGFEIETKKENLLEIFLEKKIPILNLCYHPGLECKAQCRACSVEIEGEEEPVLACQIKAEEGMKVSNLTKKILNKNRWDMEFFLLNHPMECHICHKAGDCDLQDAYMNYGKYFSEMNVNKRKKGEVREIGKGLIFSSEKCIHCGKCESFEKQITKTNSLALEYLPGQVKVKIENKVQHNYSQNLIDLCPSGAIQECSTSSSSHDQIVTEGICGLCSKACNVFYYHDKNQIYSVKPRENLAINQYWMCDKGRKIPQSNYYLPAYWKSIKAPSERVVSEVCRSLKVEQSAIVLTSHFSIEDYEFITEFMANFKDQIFAFPEILFPSDTFLLEEQYSPNSHYFSIWSKENISHSFDVLLEQIQSNKIQFLVLNIPPLFYRNEEWQEIYTKLREVKNLILLVEEEFYDDKALAIVPLKNYYQREGTYRNSISLTQKQPMLFDSSENLMNIKAVLKHFFGGIDGYSQKT